ncbi:cytosine deaminase [Sphaerisporangium melleum]|uniref:Cytosine deaminase n=1 Tax=Sphaerisporangium melleum TaxID=321316 RepID=A0A917VJ94_9ACTN|nr:amidohydrolase family protein [Sphaerisporangium melleum]GGK90423.1 cytosine deaminase [Sphaerisporangium melleum]GII72865.1 cytosine deaminase [Sphaerisporangium melleum]
MIHSAPLLLPVSRPPIRDGALAVADGMVVAVGHRREILTAYPDAQELRWPGMIVAGLVNAHTHLQFTGMAAVGARRYGSFEEWSDTFDAAYRDRPAADWASDARDGALLALRHGTTAVADVVTDIEAMPVARQAGLTGVSYLEVLGDTDAGWAETGRGHLISTLRELSGAPGGVIGIAPHAPYTLDTGVLADLGVLARRFGLRRHIHLLESAHEREYTMSGSGPLARMVRRLGFDFEILRAGGSGQGPAHFLDSLGLLGPDCHIAHGVHLDARDRALLREREVSVALCPRSNRTLGQGGPPIAALLREGNPIAVGTDSPASSPSLDLLEDVRALHRLARRQGYQSPDLARRLVEAATTGGARALGMANGAGRIGVLEPGARCDFAVFPLDPGERDPYRALVEDGPGGCVATVTGGDQAGQVHLAISAPERRHGH